MERMDFLAELAQLLSRSTREEDVIGRENGGFGILLYKTGHEGSRVLEQRLSNLIQNLSAFPVGEAPVHCREFADSILYLPGAVESPRALLPDRQ